MVSKFLSVSVCMVTSYLLALVPSVFFSRLNGTSTVFSDPRYLVRGTHTSLPLSTGIPLPKKDCQWVERVAGGGSGYRLSGPWENRFTAFRSVASVVGVLR